MQRSYDVMQNKTEYRASLVSKSLPIEKRISANCSFSNTKASQSVSPYVSVQPEGEDLFHLQKIYVLPEFQRMRLGGELFRTAVKYIRSVHPAPCRMELNVNRENGALHFYEHMGMRKVREGDFAIGNGYYMNDYIMGMEL